MADVRRLPGQVTDRWDWQIHSACRGVDSTVFFHPDFERGAERINRDATAKILCHSCPVVEQCRAHALHVREPYGIWGGLTAQERDDILHPTRKTSATTKPTPTPTPPPLDPVLAPLLVGGPRVGEVVAGVVAEPGGGSRP